MNTWVADVCWVVFYLLWSCIFCTVGDEESDEISISIAMLIDGMGWMDGWMDGPWCRGHAWR